MRLDLGLNSHQNEILCRKRKMAATHSLYVRFELSTPQPRFTLGLRVRQCTRVCIRQAFWITQTVWFLGLKVKNGLLFMLTKPGLSVRIVEPPF